MCLKKEKAINFFGRPQSRLERVQDGACIEQERYMIVSEVHGAL